MGDDKKTEVITTPVVPAVTTEGKPGESAKTTETPPAGTVATEPKKEDPPKTPEGKLAEGKKEEPKKEDVKPGEKKEEEPKDEPKFDLKVPKGAVLPADHMKKVEAYAKEKGLTPEQAQSVLERDNTLMSDYQKDAIAQLTNKVNVEWPNAAKADKELGGENFEKNVEIAKRAIDKFGSPDFKKTLNETGLGNHPELLRTFVRVGKMLTNDEFVQGGKEVPSEKESPAEAIYPNLAKGRAK